MSDKRYVWLLTRTDDGYPEGHVYGAWDTSKAAMKARPYIDWQGDRHGGPRWFGTRKDEDGTYWHYELYRVEISASTDAEAS